MKKCPSCHKKCINLLEYSGTCPCCQKTIQTPTLFSASLIMVLIAMMSVGVYINNYFLTTIGFLMIVVYKLFSYQVDLLLFPLVAKTKQ